MSYAQEETPTDIRTEKFLFLIKSTPALLFNNNCLLKAFLLIFY
jgi:hypothetical protein